MKYRNVYGSESELLIAHDSLGKFYTGNKSVNGESEGMAMGAEWKMFFLQFTALGLIVGEPCKFG